MPTTSHRRLPTEWVDEIPTRPAPTKALVVVVAAMALLGLGWGTWSYAPGALDAFLSRNPEIGALFAKSGIRQCLQACFVGFGVAGAACAAAGLVGLLLRTRLSYWLLRFSLVALCLVVLAYAVTAWIGAFAVLRNGLDVDGAKQDRATILLLWWQVCWPALAVAAYAGWLQLMMRSRSVYAVLTRKTGSPMAGDRVLEDLRTHGRDPRHRRSLYASAWTHLLIIVIIPWLLSLRGCVEAYRVPQGSGNPVVAMVKMVKPKKKKKKTLTLRPNSDIITAIPDLDETEVDREMEKVTQATYEAGAIAKAGNLGKGGGTEGGGG